MFGNHRRISDYRANSSNGRYWTNERQRERQQRQQQLQWQLQQQSLSEDDYSNNNNDIDNMREMLEKSWNVVTMGEIPTNAKSAAIAAARSIQDAINANSNENNIYFVDIQLPQYDITQQQTTTTKNLYDVIVVAEFCTELAKQLHNHDNDDNNDNTINIMFRDDTVLSTICRIFNRREGRDVTVLPTTSTSTSTTTITPPIVETKPIQIFENLENVNTSDTTDDNDNTVVEYYDDFADFEFSRIIISDDSVFTKTTTTTADIDNDDDPVPTTMVTNQQSITTLSSYPYRFTSMFGTATLSNGPDMIDSVLDAISSGTAQPTTDNEKTVIIVSAYTKQEIIGIQALINKFKPTKNFILVNCHLSQQQLRLRVPKELMYGQTVYSILPLLAKSKLPNGSLSSTTTTTTTKVVILRRYPRDWELYIDIDGTSGFQLAATVPATAADNKSGPSFEWITQAIQRYFDVVYKNNKLQE